MNQNKKNDKKKVTFQRWRAKGSRNSDNVLYLLFLPLKNYTTSQVFAFFFVWNDLAATNAPKATADTWYGTLEPFPFLRLRAHEKPNTLSKTSGLIKTDAQPDAQTSIRPTVLGIQKNVMQHKLMPIFAFNHFWLRSLVDNENV